MSDVAIATAYRELVSKCANQEPVHGFSGHQDLPRLPQADILTVLQAREHDVMDEIRLDAGYMAGALRVVGNNSIATSDLVLGSHLFVALEFAAREAIWSDVLEECQRRVESHERTPLESPESRHGVATLFRGSHR